MEAQVEAIESFPSILFFSLCADETTALTQTQTTHFGNICQRLCGFYRGAEIGTTGFADSKYTDVGIWLSAAQVWRTKNQLFG